jgi:diguanylate cyclase (GGDEF)-like protein/PAS domain S-box-containing protein
MSPANRPKILIVDDTPENIALLSDALKQDYNLTAARDAATALRLLATAHLPDLILLDIMMPEMDGYELCLQLKQNPATADIPIIFITGLTDERSELKGLRLGAVDYIHKPFSVALVRARVANMVQQIALRRQLSIYAAAFTHATDGMLITDPDGRISTANPAFERITGYRQDEAQGEELSFLRSDIQPEDFYPNLWRQLQQQGRWHGEVWSRRKSGEAFPERLSISGVRNQQGQVEHYLAVYTDISAEKEREKALINQATRDSLTGLPNRALLGDRLQQAMVSSSRDHRHYALLFIDLDRFKPINDRYGHDVGDEILRQVGQRMQLCLRRNDTLARYGGDEFVVLSQIAAAQDAEVIAAKIIQTLNRPFSIQGEQMQLGCSIGIALNLAKNSPEELIQRADKLMYQAKMAGKNCYRMGDD